MELLETRKLKKYYNQDSNMIKALDGVDIQIKKGEFVSIVGRSGSGKSTLLNLLGGLDHQTSGDILIGGEDLSVLKADELTVFRRRNIGFVFQSYNLISTLNVYENIILPLELDGIAVNQKDIDDLLKQLGLFDKKYSYPSQLSGGQQQRVAIARALSTKPLILLADEPTGNLDSQTSQDVIGLLRTTCKKFNQTVVMITHDLELAQMSDRSIHLSDGKVIS